MSLEVARTILEQLGGQKRLVVMTGAKNFVGGLNSVSFRLGQGAKNKINAVRIELSPDDTYKVDFMNIRGTTIKQVASHEGVYADSLPDIFENDTGFYLSLAPGDGAVFGR